MPKRSSVFCACIEKWFILEWTNNIKWKHVSIIALLLWWFVEKKKKMFTETNSLNKYKTWTFLIFYNILMDLKNIIIYNHYYIIIINVPFQRFVVVIVVFCSRIYIFSRFLFFNFILQIIFEIVSLKEY